MKAALMNSSLSYHTWMSGACIYIHPIFFKIYLLCALCSQYCGLAMKSLLSWLEHSNLCHVLFILSWHPWFLPRSYSILHGLCQKKWWSFLPGFHNSSTGFCNLRCLSTTHRGNLETALGTHQDTLSLVFALNHHTSHTNTHTQTSLKALLILFHKYFE